MTRCNKDRVARGNKVLFHLHLDLTFLILQVKCNHTQMHTAIQYPTRCYLAWLPNPRTKIHPRQPESTKEERLPASNANIVSKQTRTVDTDQNNDEVTHQKDFVGTDELLSHQHR